jgi:hypothetical protein
MESRDVFENDEGGVGRLFFPLRNLKNDVQEEGVFTGVVAAGCRVGSGIVDGCGASEWARSII